MSTFTLVAGLVLVAALAVGPRLRSLLPGLRAALSGMALPLVASGLALGAMLFLARDVVDVGAYVRRDVVAATASFALLWLLALRFEAATQRVVEAVLRVPIWGWAGFAFLFALASGQWLFDDIPHTSDEAAYQFQAKAYALGQLSFPVPRHLDFFGFIHLAEHAGRWHGIMNPGWPALLVPGIWLGVPGVVNPLLAAVSVLALGGAAAAAGLDRRASRLAAMLFALSPLPLFLGGTYMAHTASLALFAIFLWAWARSYAAAREGARGLGWAALAGLALGINAVVRPLDAAISAAPFGVHAAWLALRGRDLDGVWRLAATGLLAGAGVAALLAYNQALTGEPTVFPQQLHFEKQTPGERFGYGFGADMGTKLHGAEWPGYHLSDAPRVTSQRLLQWLKDLNGVPWIALAALLAVVARSRRERWSQLCLVSAGLLILVYVAHFYHGLAYGARHYALAVPVVVLALASVLGRGLDGGNAQRAASLRAALIALLAHTAIFAMPPLVSEYGGDYRMASGALREAVEREQLHDALVFVRPDRWGWKSAFPLNNYPLESNDVLFARDLGARNPELREAYPDRVVYRARFGEGRAVELTRLP